MRCEGTDQERRDLNSWNDPIWEDLEKAKPQNCPEPPTSSLPYLERAIPTSDFARNS